VKKIVKKIKITYHVIRMMTAATLTLLSTDLVSKTVSYTASYTASNVVSLGKSILYSDKSVDLSTLEQFEKKVDLLETIKIYQLWIHELSMNQSERIKQSNALQEAIHSFTKCLQELERILQSIDDKITYHKSKWFYSYRVLSFHEEIEELKLHKSIMDHRFTILRQVCGFF